jgi:hypothetical protein
LLHRADAHTGSPADAEEHFYAALGQPDADRWAFEHAVVRLEYGDGSGGGGASPTAECS